HVDTGSIPEDQDAAATDGKADASIRSIAMKNKADRTVTNGPDQLRITAYVGSAKAKITDDSLGNCKITKATSTSTRTVFAFSAASELDDGWNGCTIEFTASGYKSTLTVGMDIGD